MESRSVFAASPFLVSLESSNPTVQSNGSAVVCYTAVFSEAVTGVDFSDFVVVTGGNVRIV